MPEVYFDKLKAELFKEIKSDINFKDVAKYAEKQIYGDKDAVEKILAACKSDKDLLKKVLTAEDYVELAALHFAV